MDLGGGFHCANQKTRERFYFILTGQMCIQMKKILRGSLQRIWTRLVNRSLICSHCIEAQVRGTQREYSSKPLKHSIVKRLYYLTLPPPPQECHL